MPTKNTNYFYLSSKEEAAMKVLWSTEEPLSAAEIANRIPNRTWPATSIQGVLRVLEKKEAIQVADIVKLGKAYGRVFRPALSANEYVAMQFDRYYQDDENHYRPIISALLRDTSKPAQKGSAVKELKAFLERYEGEGS